MKSFRLKKFIFPALVALVLLLPGIAASAAESKYYMVEGRIGNADKPGFESVITRVGIIEYSGSVKSGTGQDYAIVAEDDYGNVLHAVALDVDFKSSSDVNAPQSAYSEFVALIPYDRDIEWFSLVDSDNFMLSDASPYWNYIDEIKYIKVEDTGDGFSVEWDITLFDEWDADYVDFDLIAVSRKTGEKNMLAYRTSEKRLDVPYDWLEPNDTIYFSLRCNGGWSTLFAESNEYTTPEGVEKTITEDWSENDGYVYSSDYDLKWYDWIEWYHWIFAAIALIVVVGTPILIVLLVKRR